MTTDKEIDDFLSSLKSKWFLCKGFIKGKVKIEQFQIEENEVKFLLRSGYGVNEKNIDFVLSKEEYGSFITEVKLEKADLQTEQAENDVKELRTHLFDALRGVKDGTFSPNDAKAMASVAQTILNSAKIEMEYKKYTASLNQKIKLLE